MDAVEEVKSRLSIEDVIGDYVELKRAGRNFKGISPFVAEKTPSFMVSPEKQIWHDFSSGKGGNMFSFIMEVEGLDFKGALELLARKAGIDIEQYRSKSGTRRGPNKERLYEALELATKFYQAQLKTNKQALEYVFTKRQFTKETALKWRLGYSPSNGTALVNFLKDKGFIDSEIKQAGLSAERYRGVSDMFRGRLMIPLQDPQGLVIGFTARLLTDDKNAPKYINTPQTPLYDKSRHVYGLHHAKEAIRKEQFVVIAEGNLDVISSHQAGVKQVVATAGTALTEAHLKALSRFTEDIRLSFDADRAGINATERAIPIASKVKVNLSIIEIPSGKDPDELIKQDPKLWRQATTEKQYALDWLMARYQSQLDLTTAEGKRQFSDILLPLVRSLSDAVEIDHYMNAIAETIGVSQTALQTKLAGTAPAVKQAEKRAMKVQPKTTSRSSLEYSKTQDHFLSLVLVEPQLRDTLSLTAAEMFSRDEAKEFLDFLKTQGEKSAEDIASELQARGVQNLIDYDKILVLQFEELYQGLELTELRYEAARLQARLVEQYVKYQKQRITAELATANEQRTQELLMGAKRLDDLLKRVKGGN